SLEVGSDDQQINALYPFLRHNRALWLLHELLPDYELRNERTLHQHPLHKLGINLLKLSVTCLGLIGILYVCQLYNFIDVPFWLVFAFFILIVYLDFRCSGYTHDKELIHIQTGALTRTVFITKRGKVIGVNANQSIVQKPFRLANIEIVNRASPVKYTVVSHISAQEIRLFLHWFQHRTKEIETK